MFIKVTRSEAITALLSGADVFAGDSRGLGWAIGTKLGHPERYSRRRAGRVLTRYFYGDSLFPKYAKIQYWVFK